MKIRALFWLIIMVNCLWSQNLPGLLDFRGGLGADSVVELEGQWLLANSELVYPGDTNHYQWCSIQAPKPWDNQIICGRVHAHQGKGTYRLKVLLPHQHGLLALKIGDMAYAGRVFANGKQVLQVGTPGLGRSKEHPFLLPQVLFLDHVLGDTLDLLIQISNFHDFKGGLRESIQLGNALAIEKERDHNIALTLFLFGALMIMFLYHMIVFYVRPKEKSHFYFAMICLLIAMRTIITGERVLTNVFPEIGFFWGERLEYLSFYLCIPMTMFFLNDLFPRFYRWWFQWGINLIVWISSIIVIISPVYFFTWTLGTMQTCTLIAISVTLWGFFQAWRHKQDDVVFFAVGLTIFFGFIINDILFVDGVINTAQLIPYGLLFFLFTQSLALARRYAFARDKSESLAQQLIKTNNSIARFVPNEFIARLDQVDLSEIYLGQYVREEMAVLFSDIRGFTTLSEGMTPWETFRFVNSYLRRMNPQILAHHGFVDKFIGDAIMALFPQTAENALLCALAMQDSIQEYNQGRVQAGYLPIRIGIGIHWGPVMLGIVGSEDRLQSTAISDTVNVAARIEGLTSDYGADILISRDMADQIPNLDQMVQVRSLGSIAVKGRQASFEILQVLNGFSPSELLAFEKTRDIFAKGLELYGKGHWQDSRAKFKSVLESNPLDQVAQNCLQKIDSKQGKH